MTQSRILQPYPADDHDHHDDFNNLGLSADVNMLARPVMDRRRVLGLGLLGIGLLVSCGTGALTPSTDTGTGTGTGSGTGTGGSTGTVKSTRPPETVPALKPVTAPGMTGSSGIRMVVPPPGPRRTVARGPTVTVVADGWAVAPRSVWSLTCTWLSPPFVTEPSTVAGSPFFAPITRKLRSTTDEPGRSTFVPSEAVYGSVVVDGDMIEQPVRPTAMAAASSVVPAAASRKRFTALASRSGWSFDASSLPSAPDPATAPRPRGAALAPAPRGGGRGAKRGETGGGRERAPDGTDPASRLLPSAGGGHARSAGRDRPRLRAWPLTCENTSPPLVARGRSW